VAAIKNSALFNEAPVIESDDIVCIGSERRYQQPGKGTTTVAAALAVERSRSHTSWPLPPMEPHFIKFSSSRQLYFQIKPQ
jgi:hypothetical protein